MLTGQGLSNGLFSDNPLAGRNEKVYVQLNKSVFISGELIYYKAFVVNASSHKCELQSKVLYFELMGKNGERVLSWRNNVVEGDVSASIIIPDTLASGLYSLRAYTNWMRNKSDAFYFSTNILVNRLMDKGFRTITYASAIKSGELSIDCFPENGQLVDGLLCNVGVKINSNDSASKSMNCELTDANDSIIIHFSTDNYGFGIFSFMPDITNEYTIKATSNTGITVKKVLHSIEKWGTTVTVLPEENSLKVEINCTRPEIANNEARLVIRSHGMVTFNKIIKLDEKKYTGIISTANIFPGIAQCAIYDRNNMQIYSTLFYIPPQSSLPTLNIGLNKTEFASNESAELSIGLNNALNSDKAKLSVLIAENFPFKQCCANTDIVSYLLFYSELSNSSSYSFEIAKLTPEVAKELLLCSVAKDYLWDETNNIAPNTFLMENKGYFLSGKLVNQTDNNPIRNVYVLLSYADSVANLKTAKTDSTGVFHFLLDKSYDNRELILQLFNPTDAVNNIRWILDSKDGQISSLSTKSEILDTETIKQLENFKKISLINAVYAPSVKKKTETPRNKSNKQNFFAGVYYSRILADYMELNNFEEIVTNILPGIRYKNRDDVITVNVYDAEAVETFIQPATILLNGVPFFDLEYISTLGTKDIKRIDVNNSRVMFGDLTLYGIISIITFDGKIPGTYYNNARFVYTNTVVLPDTKFETGIVSTKMISSTNFPDLRQTLFFNRKLQIVDHEKATIVFSTSLLQSTYSIVVQGVTEYGIPLSYTTLINVK